MEIFMRTINNYSMIPVCHCIAEINMLLFVVGEGEERNNLIITKYT